METCLRVDVSRLAASASGRGNQRRVESTRDLGESGSGQDMGQQEKPSLSSSSCGSVTSSQDDDWTPGLCFCSLHLPLPDQAGPGVTPPPGHWIALAPRLTPSSGQSHPCAGIACLCPGLGMSAEPAVLQCAGLKVLHRLSPGLQRIRVRAVIIQRLQTMRSIAGISATGF